MSKGKQGDYNYYLTNCVRFGMLLSCEKATKHQENHIERA